MSAAIPKSSREGSRQSRMSNLLAKLAPHEGYTSSALDGVKFMRANHALPRTPVLYEPSVVVVCLREIYRIHAEYAASLDVETPADEAGMSVAAFHAHFKAVTATSRCNT
jgi:hypothetical protein